jgi:adenine-specific DNA methylase
MKNQDVVMNKKSGNNHQLALESMRKAAPSTRYQGSKRRILDWIYENIKDLKFETVLDGFGGTASVSYLFKLMNKKVTFNDILLSNHQVGIALIENDSITLNKNDLDFVIKKNGFEYPSFIKDTFKDIYYLNSENKWLDMVAFNIQMLSERYSGDLLKKKRALAFYALFQACLCKRPFNLFHRKNLYLRTANVKRSFNNKKTWDKTFPLLFHIFYRELSQKVFSNSLKHKAMCRDILKINNKSNFDLVYLDPPYTRPNEHSPKNYFYLYHFLEGLVDYNNWQNRIDWGVKNRRLKKQKTEWNKSNLEKNFDRLFSKFNDSIIALSYGDPGNPSIDKLKELLLQYKTKVDVFQKEYSYKLNHKNGTGMYEVLLIGS